MQNNQLEEQDVNSECPSENPEKPSHPAFPIVIARFLHNAPIWPNFYATTGGSYIEMRFKPDSGTCKQLIINQTAPQYTTSGSFIESPNSRSMPEMFHGPRQNEWPRVKKGLPGCSRCSSRSPSSRATGAPTSQRASAAHPPDGPRRHRSRSRVRRVFKAEDPETHSDVRSSAASIRSARTRGVLVSAVHRIAKKWLRWGQKRPSCSRLRFAQSVKAIFVSFGDVIPCSGQNPGENKDQPEPQQRDWQRP